MTQHCPSSLGTLFVSCFYSTLDDVFFSLLLLLSAYGWDGILSSSLRLRISVPLMNYDVFP